MTSRTWVNECLSSSATMYSMNEIDETSLIMLKSINNNRISVELT